MILCLWHNYSCQNGLVTSNMAPARLHVTSVAMYPALFLFNLSELFKRQIFEGKSSVSPHFLHRYQDNNKAGMLFRGKLSLETLVIYYFFIFWPKKLFELCNSDQNNIGFSQTSAYIFFIFCGLNFKKIKQKEILHYEKHSSLSNRFGKRTMFFVFSFFYFLCKFRI